MFIVFQLIGGAVALVTVRVLYPDVSTVADQVLVPELDDQRRSSTS